MATDIEGITLKIDELNKWRTDFYNATKNELAINVCTKNNPFQVAVSRKRLNKVQHVFNHVVENEGNPITDQSMSERSWIFASLNAMRIPFMSKNNIWNFEFSQSYLYFWDKIEKSNLFLNEVILVLNEDEKIRERVMPSLIASAVDDDGSLDTLKNLVFKYGLMPKICFPESTNTEFTANLNKLLGSRLKYCAKELVDMHEAKASSEDMNKKLKEQMFDIYKIVGICIGIPREKFKWDYYSNNEAKSIGPITPLEFYNTHVKPLYNLEDKVTLVCDARPDKVYGKLYVMANSGNVIEAPQLKLNNQPIEILMDLTVKSLKAGEAVWFVCEINRRHVSDLGVQDLEILDFKSIFDVDFVLPLSRADRATYLDYGQPQAMLFTGVHIDESGKPTKFRVENSNGWGSDNGGFIVMTSAWFKEFVLSIALDKKFVPEEIMKIFEKKPKNLMLWDALFRSKEVKLYEV